jgi:ribosomal protein L36
VRKSAVGIADKECKTIEEKGEIVVLCWEWKKNNSI